MKESYQSEEGVLKTSSLVEEEKDARASLRSNMEHRTLNRPLPNGQSMMK